MADTNQPDRFARQILSEDLHELIGEGAVVALDRDWVFNPAERCIRRRDGRFFEVRMFDRGSFEQPGIYEEPQVPDPDSGDPRIVGHVVITINSGGLVHVTKARGLDGTEFVQATMSSLSNPKAVTPPGGAIRTGLVQFNPQRIAGLVLVHLVREDFPDEQGMTVEALKEQTTDGRTLAALAKIGL
jgi:hypothetical protein